MNESLSAFAVYQTNGPRAAAKKLKNKKKRDKKIKKKRASTGNDSISSIGSEFSGRKKQKQQKIKTEINSSIENETNSKFADLCTMIKNESINENEKSDSADVGINIFVDKNKKKNSKAPVGEENSISLNNKPKKLKKRSHSINADAEEELGITLKKKKSRVEKPDAKMKTIVNLLKTKKKLINIESDDEVPQLIPIKTKKRTKKNAQKSKIDTASAYPYEEELSAAHSPILKWLLSPIAVEEFLANTWETSPLHIVRQNRNYFSHILSTEGIDTMLRKNQLHFGKNVDVVTYTKGVRETHNLEGRAVPAIVWDFYGNGCSVRILNPQTYCKKLQKIIASLQEDFGCMVGANLYLTPPNSQGFAPHYDDIEAFVIQLEGEKHWKLYSPKNKNEVLPKYSSPNLTESEIGTAIMDVTLKPGDLLYFPRGIVHQASTSDKHSLHVTISTYQRTSWSDLLQKLLPEALKIAAATNVKYRKGLPIHYLKHMGVVNSDNASPERTAIINTANKLIVDLLKYAPIDAAADELGKQFMHDALPPIFTEAESLRSVKEDGERLINGVVHNKIEISLSTKIRLLRYYALRLVIENDKTAKIYYCVDNSLEYHGLENQYLEINITHAPVIEKLQTIYPSYVTVEDLPLEDDSDKLQIVGDLWERGLLITEEPLEVLSD